MIRTKLRRPFTRPELVARPRLQEQFARGLRGPLTLITAPAGFGKTTLAAAGIAGVGMPAAWLSLDKDDNPVGRFLSYLVAALQEADPTIGSEAAQLLAKPEQAAPEAVLTSLINDLDAAGREMALVLDDYQFMNSQDVHEAVAFLLEHCPKTVHLVIATRSDPPLPLARLRARGQTVELRAADLRFTEPEAAQFLNDVMGLHLEAGPVAALAERTEGWIAGLQMASIALQALPAAQSTLARRDREDVAGFIEGFSGTNRYILDYLLEEVLASQPAEIQRFLLYTSILERLSAPLCAAILEAERAEAGTSEDPATALQPAGLPACQPILEYLERANLFLAPLDDERTWYRYHHLFADLLRAQLQKALGEQGVARLHRRASEWHEQNGSTLEAIHHASLAADDERVERLIEQNYMEMVNRGEMSWLRFWTGKSSKKMVYSRPRLYIYEAQSHCWFGELDEADQLLAEAERRIQMENPAPDVQVMLGHLDHVRSRVSAMRGDIDHAIELSLAARDLVPDSDLGMQLDIRITLGYEYFMKGDFAHASPVLQETIQSGFEVGSIINTVAAACVLARLYAIQGRLNQASDLYQAAAQWIPESSGRHLGAKALVEAGKAELDCERNDLESAFAHVNQALDLMPWWGKADDFALAYVTLARIHLAQANQNSAAEAVEKAVQAVQKRGVFSEARSAVETAQVKMWLAHGDRQAANRWAAALEQRFGSPDLFRYEDELARITQARVFIAQGQFGDAARSLSRLEESARSGGRLGRLVEILALQGLALQKLGDTAQARLVLAKSLALAEPGGYVRVFLEEGRPMQSLLAKGVPHEQVHGVPQAGASPVQDYAARVLSQFAAEPPEVRAAPGKISAAGDLVEPLTPRELDVLRLLAQGLSNRQIAEKLVLSEGTVKFYVHTVMEKLEVHSRTQAILIARERNLV